MATKSKKAPKVKRAKKAKQADLPGMEDRRLDELHAAADHYLDAKDEAKTASDAKKAAESALVAEMRKVGKTSYSFDGLTITVKPKDDGVTVKDANREKEEVAA